MNKQRMNVQTIAEVLIQELDKMEQTSKRIEQASSKPLSVDLKEFREELAHLEQITKNHTKAVVRGSVILQRWIVSGYMWLMAFLILFCIGTAYLSGSYKNKYETEKERSEFFLKKLNEERP